MSRPVEVPFSVFSHIEAPAPGARLRPGRHLIRGWVWPGAGRHFVDVRARMGDRHFAGIHGIPRADLAAHFQLNQPYALAGFHVVIAVTPGPVELVLEALELEGRWIPFQSVSYQVEAGGTPADVSSPSGPLRWHEYGRALQLLLRAQRRTPAVPLSRLADELVAGIPYPRDLLHPHPPFRGYLDEPAAVTQCGFGRTPVFGHLFHEQQAIRRVLATFDLQAWQTIGHGNPSPVIGQYYPQVPGAQSSALFGIIDTVAQLPNPVSLRLYAELADGSLHLCFVQRSQLYTLEDAKAPYPPLATSDVATVHAVLQAAFQQHGITVREDEEFHREVARIQNDFALHAPRALPPDSALRAGPAPGSGPLPKRILLVTHNLNLEGAPLFLVDYARYLAARGSQLVIISPADGPLRSRFEEFGATVRLLDVTAIFAAQSAGDAQESIKAVTRSFNFSVFDLVIANTFTTFWAVHAAKAADRRVLFYVHESTTPASFYLGRVHPSVVALAEAAFGLADGVSFTTAATRRYHTDYGRPEKHRLTPGWIDVARIDAWRAQHPREQLRAGFNLRPDELLVTNVGTVCDRKGQHIFARGVDLLWRRHPALAARCRFVMLGGGDTPFDAILADLLVQLGRPNLVVHPATADYLAYYAAADLFVCSTYEESSPRVILEAMACETPLLSSAVHGIPEQVRPGVEATLIPPGDTVALCEGMAQLLQMPALGRELARCARTRVVAEFDARVLLPRHAALTAAVAAGQV
jgi:glycosyltransferase involved in cell wall biosynthesis